MEPRLIVGLLKICEDSAQYHLNRIVGFSFVAVPCGHCVVAQPKFNSHLNISVKMHPGQVVGVRMACVTCVEHVGLVCSTDRKILYLYRSQDNYRYS